MKIEDFIPTEFGWVSSKTPPINHNKVVVLVWHKTDELYLEELGYYEHEKWQLDNDNNINDYEIHGWFPYPYTPHNH